ncbi:MAG TPA: N-6 DNA methylase [Solirubrobacteraceae bacterium]|nr:N-6 DNA methylase [Solirubrobacteraceae bacterium]
MSAAPQSPPAHRKARGAFFTPPAIADFLSRWAVRTPNARVLDPTCGEAVFLLAAADRLETLGTSPNAIAEQLTGVDLHQPSLDASAAFLRSTGVGANLVRSDFFDLSTPAQIGDQIGWQDAVIGNPPFVRYQEHRGQLRKRSAAAALAQGVRLSGLASSWAATLVHASGFLTPAGRLAMVLPAELLTVGYAEPIRRWLKQRFAIVNLVMFERLQFRGADEQVVLLVAHGTGPCDSFCLFHVDSADDLAEVHPLDPVGANPAAEGKWSDLALSLDVRQLFRSVAEQMVRLDGYGTPELGTVTGNNDYFTMSEATRAEYGIAERHLTRISPPGTRHLKGLDFSREQWDELKLSGKRVWLLYPKQTIRDKALMRYLERGREEAVHEAYKCTVREPWWRPPVVPVPDLFFTYMSHRYPRLIDNTAGAAFVNSMHGLRLRDDAPDQARSALPLVALNSVTMLGAEIMGRSYGGGILKMEPREAAALPVPAPEALASAWRVLAKRAPDLDAALKRGEWWTVVAAVDQVLLKQTLGLSNAEIIAIQDAATLLRVRRTRQTEEHPQRWRSATQTPARTRSSSTVVGTRLTS